MGVVSWRWALPTPAPSPWFLPPHCRCRPGRGRSWGSARPPSPPSSPTASAGATATCGSPSPRDATSDVSCPPGLLWAPVPLLQWPLAQESSSPFLFLGNFIQPSSLLVKWGSGKVGIKSEFCDPGSWVLLGIRLENRIAVGFKIEADPGPTTGSGLFLPPS